jgi:hypothetical protein
LRTVDAMADQSSDCAGHSECSPKKGLS